ncbi:NAD(+)/NADH kinase [Halalkalirubrum salinum]|uniref:NAD(+)/NADH kinase n=1 Tax=Halalkalirubrum salinum TaxID=2563889 RepID=UPI0010FB2D8A|nr:NAD(+)/NADH kinase [Halalkalirubrum salinum]
MADSGRSDPVVGVIVNPAAGRDIRRLTGGASVSDNYAKRRTAACVLAGLSLAREPVRAIVMPDASNLGQRIVDDAEDEAVSLLDMPVSGSAEDTRRAAEAFSSIADCVVVLGGDGTNRDVATGIGETPVVSVSTGTNNVVPTPMDGTVAGGAAGLVAAGAVDRSAVTYQHGTITAEIHGSAGSETVSGLATMGLLDRPFVGTRAVLDVSSFVCGVVSRASPAEIGISGVAGGLETHAPDSAGGIAMEFGDGGQTIRAMTVPGIVESVSIARWSRLAPGDPYTVEIDRGVVTADGEREYEVADASVSFIIADDGPRLVDVDAAFGAAAERGLFIDSS